MRTVWDELTELAAQDHRLSELDLRAAHAFVERLATEYLTDRNRKWWWESLKPPTVVVNYGDDDGIGHLGGRISNQPAVMLVVTDEQPEPHGVLRGPGPAILMLLQAVPFFEYVVADPGLAWLIFDTHHNHLILAGDVPQSGGSAVTG